MDVSAATYASGYTYTTNIFFGGPVYDGYLYTLFNVSSSSSTALWRYPIAKNTAPSDTNKETLLSFPTKPIFAVAKNEKIYAVSSSDYALYVVNLENMQMLTITRSAMGYTNYITIGQYIYMFKANSPNTRNISMGVYSMLDGSFVSEKENPNYILSFPQVTSGTATIAWDSILSWTQYIKNENEIYIGAYIGTMTFAVIKCDRSGLQLISEYPIVNSAITIDGINYVFGASTIRCFRHDDQIVFMGNVTYGSVISPAYVAYRLDTSEWLYGFVGGKMTSGIYPGSSNLFWCNRIAENIFTFAMQTLDTYPPSVTVYYSALWNGDPLSEIQLYDRTYWIAYGGNISRGTATIFACNIDRIVPIGPFDERENWVYPTYQLEYGKTPDGDTRDLIGFVDDNFETSITYFPISPNLSSVCAIFYEDFLLILDYNRSITGHIFDLTVRRAPYIVNGYMKVYD